MKPNNDAERSVPLGRLYMGAVADILGKLGHQFRNQCFAPDIRPLDPAMMVAGPVFTVCGRARPAAEPIEVLS